MFPEYDFWILRETANLANTAGMGNYVSPGINSIPGQPGSEGSGDLGSNWGDVSFKLSAPELGGSSALTDLDDSATKKPKFLRRKKKKRKNKTKSK